MILLQFGSNDVYLTLEEARTITSAQYVFVFINDNTGKKVACTATDTYSDPTVYNKFTITVASSNIPASGHILLDDYGFYHYYVYQTADASTFDYTNINTTDIRTLTGLIEQGKMYYEPPATSYTYYKDTRSSIITYKT